LARINKLLENNIQRYDRYFIRLRKSGVSLREMEEFQDAVDRVKNEEVGAAIRLEYEDMIEKLRAERDALFRQNQDAQDLIEQLKKALDTATAGDN
jgi:hypothetical protein